MRRRATCGALAATVAVAILAAPARADQRITAGFRDTFTTPSVTIGGGERLTFQNLDVDTHNVTSVKTGPDGQTPLFATPTTAPNSETSVDGAQRLAPGSYAFICTLHSGMQGTLTVTGAGPPPPPDTTPPTLRLRVLSSRLSAVVRSGQLPVSVNVDKPATVTLTATVGRQKIAGGSGVVTGSGTLKLRLTSAGKRLLRSKRRAGIAVSGRARDASGNQSSPGNALRTLRS